MDSMLSLSKVNLRSGSTQILDDISLEIGHGQMVVILGSNGAGKTSLLRSLLAQVSIDSGSIHIAGQDLADLDARQRARWMAWLPQQGSRIEALRVEEVVAAARFRFDEPRAQSLRIARSALEKAGAASLQDRWWPELSGGERQRIEMATLIAQEADCWLLDEPANHLDPVWRKRVLSSLEERVREGTTIVVVLHDVHLLKSLDGDRIRIVGLREGRLVWNGLFSDPDLEKGLKEIYRDSLPVTDKKSELEIAGGGAFDMKSPWQWCLAMLVAVGAALASTMVGPSLSGEIGQEIFTELRLPRALAGAILGAVFAGAGAVVQILLQNPLATPSTVGTTAGASLGVIAALVMASGSTFLGLPLLPAAAFIGALTVTLAIASVAARTRSRTEDVLLAGIALTLATGALSSALRLGFDQVTSLNALRWSLGSLTLVGYERLQLLAPFVTISIVGMLWLIRSLEVLATGIDRAATRGVDVPRVRTLGLGFASLGVAAAVATCGPIAFVGLICPHLIRRVVGSGPRVLVPASMLLGCCFLPLCDAIGRTVLENRDVPVGVITAALGAPVLFLLVLRRSRQS